jgi:hypothetical protein
MIRFPYFRKNTAPNFRVTNVPSGCWSDTEDEMRHLCSLLEQWKIVRGGRICTGPMEISIRMTPSVVSAPTGCGKSSYLFAPNTLKPPYITDTFLSLCHFSIHMNEFSHPQGGDSRSTVPKHHMIQQPKRRPSIDQ